MIIAFTVALLSLAWLSRQLSFQIQLLLHLITRSADLTVVLLFLLLLPGVVIHEAAHWIAAYVLGLKPSKFRVWPKKQRQHIGLGSVSVRGGMLWQESLVGLAPLIAGSALIALIAEHVFDAQQFSLALGEQRWLEGILFFQQSLLAPDGMVWAYLLFAIANAMMPSASDREPLRPLLLMTILVIGLYLLFGLPVAPFTLLLDWLAPILHNITNALLFTIALDLVILAILYLLIKLIAPQPVARG
ncbi:MAG: hypothetical protein KF832_15795 [Caldilineaceae bacterium]|nr:hypothetical protein [Caldilineaceae bacterium]